MKKSGINPRHWGPHMWKSIHFVAFGYPQNPTKEDAENYKKYYMSLPYVLPCDECKEHFTQIMKDPNTTIKDSDLKNQETLARWTYNIHNIVNKRLGVEYQLSYEEFKSTYEFCKSDCRAKVACSKPKETKPGEIFYDKAPIVDYEFCQKFEKLAEKKNVTEFKRVLELTKKHINDIDFRIKRDKICWKIINHMKLNNMMHLDKDGELNKYEIALFSMMCTSMKKHEQDEIAKFLQLS